jgi:hypothetical protein
MRSAWLGVIVATLLGSSSVALAEEVKPQPGVEMTLEERGPCSVIDCRAVQELVMEDLRPRISGPRDLWKYTIRGDMRRAERLLRYHYLSVARLRAYERALEKVSAELAACEAGSR